VEGQFRDLNAAVVRITTLSLGGRISVETVEEEVDRLTALWANPVAMSKEEAVLKGLDEEKSPPSICLTAHNSIMCLEYVSEADPCPKPDARSSALLAHVKPAPTMPTVCESTSIASESSGLKSPDRKKADSCGGVDPARESAMHTVIDRSLGKSSTNIGR